ncbi:hypothetical protein ABPG74_018685 [Tetrahymena malaccensis]
MNIFIAYQDQEFEEYYENNYDLFLLNNDSQIIEYYINRCRELEKKLLKEYLKSYKPHFQIENDLLFLQCKNWSVQVFDSKQNLKKQLIIVDSKKKEIIEYYIQLFKFFPRKDLIQNLYDSYYLDQDETFYVFELEISDFMLYNLQQNLQHRIRSKLKSFFCEFFQSVFNSQIYDLISNQKELKVNLFSFSSELYIFLNRHKTINSSNFILKGELVQKAKNKIQYSYFFTQFENYLGILNFFPNNNNFQYEDNYFDQQEDQYMPQNWFEKSIIVIINKEQLLEKIASLYPDLLKLHEEDIFQFIQMHPKYEQFQVLSFNTETFKLKIKTQKDLKFLVVSKFSSLEKVEEEERLINLQANITKNLIFTEIIFIQKYFYLFVEYNYFQPNKVTLHYPSIQDLLLASQSKFSNQLIVFQMLVEISYELFSKFKIKITNICPSKIILLGIQEQTFNVVIEELTCERFNQQYNNLILQSQDTKKYYAQQDNNTQYIPNLIIKFLDEINSYSETHIDLFYQNLIQHINLLKLVIDHNYLDCNYLYYQNNKLQKNLFSAFKNSINLIDHAYLTTSLDIALQDYVQFYQDAELKDFYISNQLFKKQWSLPNSLQQMHLIKKLETYLNSFNKNNDEQISNVFERKQINTEYFEDQANRQSDKQIINPFLSDLQNLLNIILSNNLNQNVVYELSIRQNDLTYNRQYQFEDQEYFNIYQELINGEQKYLLLTIQNNLTELTIKFLQIKIAYAKETSKNLPLQKFNNLQNLRLFSSLNIQAQVIEESAKIEI